MQRNHFDAWGNVVTPDSLNFTITSRGFTGHEHYPELKIINMNRRLYDPVIGRFFSPDNFVQVPEFTQNLNRYSYALNNPLKYIDPEGNLLYITGDQTMLDFDQLNSFTNLNLVINTQTGKVTAPDGMIVDEKDKLLLDIIENPRITVNITATSSNTGNLYGGAFWGNKVVDDNMSSKPANLKTPFDFSYFVKLNNRKIITDQRVDPSLMRLTDFFGVWGQTLFHEITESYWAGNMSYYTGISALPAKKGNSTYNTIFLPAHNLAYLQPSFTNTEFLQLQKGLYYIQLYMQLFNW